MKRMRVRISTRERAYVHTELNANPQAFETGLQALRIALTPKRLEIWRLIRDEKPVSIWDLSKRAGRDFKRVYEDLKVLVSLGIIKIQEIEGPRGEIKRPISLIDAVTIEVR